MSKQITIATILIAALLVLVSIVQIVRYEYHYEGHLRIDRLTGQHQYHCTFDNDWKTSLDDCTATRKIKLIDKNAPTIKTQGSPLAKCLSDSEYIAKNKSEGFICQGVTTDGHPVCGEDRDSNGKIEPWEMNWYGIASICH